MDKRYELFCLADPLFYDSPSSSRAAKQEFAVASPPLPGGWTRTSLGEWQVQVPPGDPVPAQGWKIHVSASQDNAERVLEEIFDYCVPRRISFKFLRGPLALHIRNAKYAPRGSSGKLATIYPADDDSCERILAELDSIVGGEHGPYILSDLRYARGPLYVRYGAFLQQHCQAAGGELVPAIRDHTGQLVPDVRGPVFTVPDWVDLPQFLAPHLAARNAVTVQDLPYQIEQALHFSNGGGVYLGTDSATGERVVLKEARPYAGLAPTAPTPSPGCGASTTSCGSCPAWTSCPAPAATLEAGEHHFLVMDHIDGAPLNSLYAYRHPLIEAEPDPDQHRRLHVLGAGHLRPRGAGRGRDPCPRRSCSTTCTCSTSWCGRTTASRSSTSRRPRVSATVPGRRWATRASWPRATGPDSTLTSTASACVKLAMFLPLTTLFALDLGKAAHIAEVIAESLPRPAAVPGFRAQRHRRATQRPHPRPPRR